MTIATERWTTTPLKASFGVEFSGSRIDIESDGDWVLDQLETNLFLVFREQFLTHAEQVALARAIGEPTPAHPVVPGHPDHPEILELDGAKGGKNAQWHTDVTFSPTPPAASVLVADELPSVGGDTLWADLRGAYEGLSPVLRGALDQMEAVHRITPLAYWGVPHDTALSREDALELLENAKKVPPVVHPVVRVHPATGRPALFVNPGFTSHLLGLSAIESEALLSLLYAHTTQPEFIVRHQWQPGDVVLWDNRATMHYACDDYGDAPRRMRRVTIRGAAPFGLDGRKSRVLDDPFLSIR
jgi:alpha-ketoglutarate-dependent taurine dioxygenase